jgi:catechol 2,3-dioxygenase-like lactoylglutathione lyase family enzyme
MKSCQVFVGNHAKVNAPAAQRDQLREFYTGVLGCRMIEAPSPDFDLFEFSGDFVWGVFYGDEHSVLAATEHAKATWLELKTSNPVALKNRLKEFGVTPIDYPDPDRFYFQAPDGQVWRIAAVDGGI